MTDAADEGSPLDALSDEEYNLRVNDAVGALGRRFEDALRGEDPPETDLLLAAAPTALRNLLAHLIAEECLSQPRPYRMVKESIRDLDLEGLSLAILKDLQAEDAQSKVDNRPGG